MITTDHYDCHYNHVSASGNVSTCEGPVNLLLKQVSLHSVGPCPALLLSHN
jgi:hypothetical protein